MKLPILTLISIATAFIAIVVGLSFWSRQPKELRVLTLYLIIGFLIGMVMVSFALQGNNNLWLMHVYTPIQFSFLMWLFSYWSQGGTKRLILLSIPLFILFWAVMFLFFENLARFNTFTRPTEALILIGVSGYVLYKTTKESDEAFYLSIKFWVASGTLIYFSGMIFLYALFNQLLVISAEHLNLVWTLTQTVTSVLSYLMYIMSFLCLSPRLRPQQ